MRGPLARQIKRSLKTAAGSQSRRPANECLGDVRSQPQRPRPQRLQIDRNFAPTEKLQPELTRSLLEQLGASIAMHQIAQRHEQHTDREIAGRRRARADLGQFTRHECMRNLGKHASTVSGATVGRHGPAMGVVAQRLQGKLKDLMAALPMALRHVSNPARVVFEGRIVKRSGLIARKRLWLVLKIWFQSFGHLVLLACRRLMSLKRLIR